MQDNNKKELHSGPETAEDTVQKSLPEEASHMTQPVVIKLIETGNVTLIFPATTTDEQTVHLVVSAEILCCASEVWKKMFTGSMKEANTLRQSGSVEVPLEDDNPAAMQLILSVLHCQTESLTSLPSLDLIIQIRNLCGKYMFLHMYTWIRDWLRSHPVDELNTFGVGLFMIAARFCSDELFETAHGHAVTTFTPDFEKHWKEYGLFDYPDTDVIYGMYIVA